ncbi:conserved hypothetical protein [Tenacibaculum litopenaei]|uniref:cupin domain-containing protein n=1 Tax=Tenacibaculum litopenaei TaxID=396016 RepID=UPI0038958946
MNTKTTKMTAQQIIDKFELIAHPEGGYFKETYRSSELIAKTALPPVFSGPRNYATSIYFLLTSEKFSAFHKINQDEIWHFYTGSSIYLHIIAPDGSYTKVTIGNRLEDDELPQFVVPAGHWFAAEVSTPNSYAFTGCGVAPGFDFEDFQLPSRAVLCEEFPQHTALITRLTHH